MSPFALFELEQEVNSSKQSLWQGYTGGCLSASGGMYWGHPGHCVSDIANCKLVHASFDIPKSVTFALPSALSKMLLLERSW